MFGKGPKLGIRRPTIVEVGVLLIIGVVITAMVYPMLDKPDKMGPKEFTRSKLRRIEGRILDFYSENKEWPEQKVWEQQLSSYFVHDRSFSPEEIVLDAWGKKIKYEVRRLGEDRQPVLHSSGPDGIDDGGSNDDIVIEVWRPNVSTP